MKTGASERERTVERVVRLCRRKLERDGRRFDVVEVDGLDVRAEVKLVQLGQKVVYGAAVRRVVAGAQPRAKARGERVGVGELALPAA